MVIGHTMRKRKGVWSSSPGCGCRVCRCCDPQCYVVLAMQGSGTEPEHMALLVAHRERIERQLRDLRLSLLVTEYKLATHGGHDGGPGAMPS